MISKTAQGLIMAGMVALAIGALALGALYQDDDKLGDAVVVGLDDDATVGAGGAYGGAGGSGADVGPGSADGASDDPAGTATGPAGPIERFLPQAGEASACREEVGVDLVDGFGATLTINGIPIAPEDMNVNLDENGRITGVITASRSVGHYTFSPDDDCPNGRYLRPVDNVLEVCVYRLEDADRRCAVTTEHVFDAL